MKRLTARHTDPQHVLTRLALTDVDLVFVRCDFVMMLVRRKTVLMLVVIVIAVHVYMTPRVAAEQREHGRHQQHGCQAIHAPESM